MAPTSSCSTRSRKSGGGGTAKSASKENISEGASAKVSTKGSGGGASVKVSAQGSEGSGSFKSASKIRATRSRSEPSPGNTAMSDPAVLHFAGTPGACAHERMWTARKAMSDQTTCRLAFQPPPRRVYEEKLALWRGEKPAAQSAAYNPTAFGRYVKPDATDVRMAGLPGVARSSDLWKPEQVVQRPFTAASHYSETYRGIKMPRGAMDTPQMLHGCATPSLHRSNSAPSSRRGSAPDISELPTAGMQTRPFSSSTVIRLPKRHMSATALSLKLPPSFGSTQGPGTNPGREQGPVAGLSSVSWPRSSVMAALSGNP